MFCDLVGSTALASRLDPEDLREVIAAYHRCVAETVSRLEGFVAKYMGDGVLAYFGYPRAHEDDAERAVRAGLGLVDAVGRLDVKSVKLQARVGIATGLVIVGDLVGEGSAQERSVVGETPNLAARLQTLAGSDSVVIAASTRRLTGNLFEYRDLGDVEIKGLGAPVSAWEVLRPSGVVSRFEALHGTALAPLVGRGEEIDLLLRRWACANAGNGQVVLISGEPGIGKSRITAALEARLDAELHLRLLYFCSPYHQDSALFPFIGQLDRAAGFTREDPPAAKLQKLETLLARAVPLDEDVAFLADLMSLPASERHPLPNLSPQRKKERTLEALIQQLEGLARHQPVVMVFEDAHWIDPTSRELLDLVVERVRSLPVLLIVTFRPEFQPPWIGQPQVTTLALSRLDQSDRIALVAQIAGNKMLPREVVDQIAERTDGVPLFVEELTKSILESGLLREEGNRYVLDRALPPFAIPMTLHDSLMARLDRLAPIREVAQFAATLGREFSYELLAVSSPLDEWMLQHGLARLVEAEVLYQQGMPPRARYLFKHVLIQDAAYQSLLRSKRQQYHQRIAETLETRFIEVGKTQPELIAHHYTEAGLGGHAIPYWQKAAQRSIGRSANLEAIAHLTKALQLLDTLPSTRKRAQEELALQITLGGPLIATRGHSAPEVEKVYARARDLCGQVGDTPQLCPVLNGLRLFYVARGELQTGRELGERCLGLAQQAQDSALVLEAHQSLGIPLFFMGEFALARTHLEQSIVLYDPEQHRSRALLQGRDPGVVGPGYLGWTLWFLGYPQQALRWTQEALSLARQIAHAPSIAIALNCITFLHQHYGEARATQQWAEEMIALATEQGLPLWLALETILRGWALAEQGEREQGIVEMRRGLARYQATGSELNVPYFLALLAEVVGKVEGPREGLVQLAEASAMMDRNRECAWEPELYRLKGELTLLSGRRSLASTAEEAEGYFRQALAIAGSQHAKSWELRAAISLARLWKRQGKKDDARRRLTEIYAWFTEGFDAPDLRDAKALLDELT
jgi:class 3 adenylate cyclase/predicted ATPase